MKLLLVMHSLITDGILTVITEKAKEIAPAFSDAKAVQSVSLNDSAGTTPVQKREEVRTSPDEDTVFSIEDEIDRIQAERVGHDDTISKDEKLKATSDEQIGSLQKKERADHYFSKGLEAMDAMEYEEAMSSFEMAIKHFVDSTR